MATRYNFNPGPAVLPTPVIERVRDELPDYGGTGMSVMELSHRSPEYERINAEFEERLRALLGLGEDYAIMLIGGGANLQFAMAPLNLLRPGRTADYLVTGAWSAKALQEACTVGEARAAVDLAPDGYRRAPHADELALGSDAAYVYLCSNETISGVQWHAWPETHGAPLVGDMSSDLLSRPLDTGRFGLFYACAQKNLGPAGLTVVVARRDLLDDAPAHVPAILRYATFARSASLYNTPPVWAVYVANLMLGWLVERGGLAAIAERNAAKSGLVYDAIDHSGGFYRGHAEPASRSIMNATFRLPTPELERAFLAEAEREGFTGLPGHRSVGGVRASMYNALELDACAALAAFMREFARTHG